MNILIGTHSYDGSYPYLNIARKYRVDYGDVLWYAEYIENSNALIDNRVVDAVVRIEKRPGYEQLKFDVDEAVQDFRRKRGLCS